MRRLFLPLRNRRGYVMLAVLCVLLIFSVMGINVLVAAYAGTGTAAKKKSSSQAYLLTSSALPNLANMIEKGDMDYFIIDQLLDPAGTCYSTGGKPEAEALRATVTAEVPGYDAALSMTMYLRDVSYRSYLDEFGMTQVMVLATLTVRVTTEYQEESYSLLMDFSQRPNSDRTDVDTPEEPQPPQEAQPTKWLLRNYRTSRSTE